MPESLPRSWTRRGPESRAVCPSNPGRRAQFDALRGPGGALFVGTPEEVADKILYQHALFGHTRFVMHPSVGTLPHAGVMRAIELLGTEVAPVVRAEVARRPLSIAGAAAAALILIGAAACFIPRLSG